MTAMYTLERGGSYDRFVMMLEAFLERGCAVHCLSLKPIRIENPCFYNHILFYPFGNKENSMAKLTVFFFFPIWSIWVGRKYKIDLIIAFGLLYAFSLSFSKWLLQRPMVTFIRGNFAFGLRMRHYSTILVLLNKMIEYFGLFFSDKIITNNCAFRDEILKRLRKKNIDVRVLYNNIPPMSIREKEDGLQARDKYGIPGNAKVLVTAGILSRGKNIETLINCLPQIGIENLYLIVVGDGSTEADFRYRESLQGLAIQLGFEKNVIFTGWLEKEEVRKIYLTSDLFVLPSLNEGMPNAMLEALGSDLSCLGTNIPGIRELLYYDKLLFDPLDGKSLADKIQKLLRDPEDFGEIKNWCCRRKKEFTFNWKERLYELVMHTFSGGSYY